MEYEWLYIRDIDSLRAACKTDLTIPFPSMWHVDWTSNCNISRTVDGCSEKCAPMPGRMPISYVYNLEIGLRNITIPMVTQGIIRKETTTFSFSTSHAFPFCRIEVFFFNIPFNCSYCNSLLHNLLHTCRKFRMAPLILSESAAIPAIPPPSAWSRSCRREVEGAAPWTQFAPQQGADASGWELCLMIRVPGSVVTTVGGATGQELHDTCRKQPPLVGDTRIISIDDFLHFYFIFLIPRWLFLYPLPTGNTSISYLSFKLSKLVTPHHKFFRYRE